MNDKSCANCIHAEPITKTSEHKVTTGLRRYNCSWYLMHKVPVSMHVSQTYMYENEGVHCPCHERKRNASVVSL